MAENKRTKTVLGILAGVFIIGLATSVFKNSFNPSLISIGTIITLAGGFKLGGDL